LKKGRGIVLDLERKIVYARSRKKKRMPKSYQAFSRTVSWASKGLILQLVRGQAHLVGRDCGQGHTALLTRRIVAVRIIASRTCIDRPIRKTLTSPSCENLFPPVSKTESCTPESKSVSLLAGALASQRFVLVVIIILNHSVGQRY
jgi:hypothetical protein